jgi:hypothetical protein
MPDFSLELQNTLVTGMSGSGKTTMAGAGRAGRGKESNFFLYNQTRNKSVRVTEGGTPQAHPA